MSQKLRLDVSAALAIIVAIATLGVIISAQGYLMLQSERGNLLARKVLDESFLAALKARSNITYLELEAEVANRQQIVDHSYSSASTVIRQIEYRVFAGILGWGVVLMISGATLIVFRRNP